MRIAEALILTGVEFWNRHRSGENQKSHQPFPRLVTFLGSKPGRDEKPSGRKSFVWFRSV